nr:carboxylesterase family protein [Nanchangia anserum]
MRGLERSLGTGTARSWKFWSLPVSAPPVGPLRFAAPQPAPEWSGIREATRPGPTPQRRPLAEVTGIPEPSYPGEDTLTATVCTPSLDPSARLPVLVWIHGGGYKGGSPASPWYDGAAFTRDGIVTVALSYRLGFEGFGAIPGCPTNRGLLDQIAGLEWVRRSITAFGGDPDAVTIAGQSAGGGSVLALAASPAARGLFRGVIAVSPAFAPASAAEARELTDRLAAIVGVHNDREAWQGVDEEVILDAAAQLEGELAPSGLTPEDRGAALIDVDYGTSRSFGPSVEDGIIPENWIADLADVPLMIGSTAHEFTSFGHVLVPPDGQDRIDATVRERLGTVADLIERDLAGTAEAGFIAGQLLTIGIFRGPVVDVADAHERTWVYDYRVPDTRTGLAEHCMDVPAIFDCLDHPHVAHTCGPDVYPDVAADIHAAWVRFIREGEPGWQPWNRDGRARVWRPDGGEVAAAYATERALRERQAR